MGGVIVSKRILKRIGAACVIIVLTVTGTFLLIMLLGSLLSYIEKQDCICAKLTPEEQEFVIDD